MDLPPDSGLFLSFFNYWFIGTLRVPVWWHLCFCS